MTSPTVDENPEPGESGYYDWHKAVAKHHNDKAGVGAHHAASRVSVTTSGLAVVSSTDVQGALSDLDSGNITAPDSPSDGDALVFDSGTSAWTADSGTYHKADEPAARLERSTNQTISAGTVTTVSWETAVFDNTGGSMWSSGSPTLLTLPEAGIYAVIAGIQWVANNTGERRVQIRVGGALLGINRVPATNESEGTVATLVSVSGSSDITCEVEQKSGSSLDIRSTRPTFFAAQKVAES